MKKKERKMNFDAKEKIKIFSQATLLKPNVTEGNSTYVVFV